MLAIIIPYYKLTFFKETLESLASQTDKRFKVYIGDDASVEDCRGLLRAYEGKFDFKYHRFENNLGSKSLTKQWERCIRLSTVEEWLMILGDDDYLDSYVVASFYKLLGEVIVKPDLIRFNLHVVNEKNELLHANTQSKVIETSDELLDKIFSMKEYITMSEFVFSKEIYKLNNGFIEFPLAWFSDYATWLLYAKKTGIYNINNAVVYWRWSNINISSKARSIKEVELKISSLFLFNSFVKEEFLVDSYRIKTYVFKHLRLQLIVCSFYQSIQILLTLMYRIRKIVVTEMLFKYIYAKVKKKFF